MSLFDKFRKKRSVTRKKGWEFYPASKRATDWDEIHFRGRKLKFGNIAPGSKAFYTEDSGLARELTEHLSMEKGSGDLISCEVDNPGAKSPRRVFQVPAMPWEKEK